jgi:hypothetical protein
LLHCEIQQVDEPHDLIRRTDKTDRFSFEKCSGNPIRAFEDLQPERSRFDAIPRTFIVYVGNPITDARVEINEGQSATFLFIDYHARHCLGDYRSEVMERCVPVFH